MRFPAVSFSSSAGRRTTGRSPRDLSRAYAAGELVRLRRGIYVPVGEWLAGTAEDRYAITTASLALAEEPPVLCRETALMAWGVEFARTPTHVRYRTASPARAGSVRPTGLYGNEPEAVRAWTQTHKRAGPLPQGFPHAKHLWTPGPSESFYVPHLGLALRIEPFDAAFADTIHRLPFAEAVVVVDALLAQRSGLKAQRSLSQLRALVPTLPSASARVRAQCVLDFGDGVSESVGESFGRALMWELGFETPELQVWILRAGRRIARVDYLWRSIRLVGEFDGLKKYLRSLELSGKSAAQVVVEEKRREDEVRGCGYGMVRWTWADLMEPQRFAAILHRAGVPRRQSAPL
ncbi:type IV toxin-antitoxin system AbiEi family antitoxin domain-containing protein [Sinomonas halotolerans]|uniref:Type IV toxin-antitoxin system AbiEi family antitoxin domain-containing protein n=1 Tax=Sinomonas halotolerans TaxID=1644133 RepID=A0ABU9WX50_9MICC